MNLKQWMKCRNPNCDFDFSFSNREKENILAKVNFKAKIDQDRILSDLWVLINWIQSQNIFHVFSLNLKIVKKFLITFSILFFTFLFSEFGALKSLWSRGRVNLWYTFTILLEMRKIQYILDKIFNLYTSLKFLSKVHSYT